MNKDVPAGIARLIDVSCVKQNHTLDEINRMAEAAKKYRFVCAFALPYFTPFLLEKLKGETDITVGGTIGFPSGSETTACKVFEAHELARMGCGELDMVINITQLKSHNMEQVYDDIKAVAEAAGKIPLKTILEVTLLTNDEITAACGAAVSAGAAYIKTGTGWQPGPTTIQHIELIKKTIGNKAKIKAAGGIRDLDTLLRMKQAGCDRFGIGLHSAVAIMKQAYG